MSILSRLFPKHDGGSTPATGTPIPGSASVAPVDPGEGEPTPADPAAMAPAPPPPAPAARTTGSTPTVGAVPASLPAPNPTAGAAAPPANKKGRDSQTHKDTVKEHAKVSPQRLTSTLIGPSAPAVAAPPPASGRRGHPVARRERPDAGAVPTVAGDIEATVAAALDQLLSAPADEARPSPTSPARLTPATATAASAPSVPSAQPTAAPAWTAADRASARATFEELSGEHVRPVRNMMLELEWGGPAAAWMVGARGALASLRRMADQIEFSEASEAITGYLALLDQAIVDGALSDDVSRRLNTAYTTLSKALPRAFELRGERDRREPILIQALLGQVPGLEPLMVQRLFGVGLGRLDSLLRATAEEVAVVADLPAPVAGALVDKAQELRKSGGAAAPEITDAGRLIGPLLATLKRQQGEYARAALGWTADNLSAKRRHRRERELTYQKIRMAVTRLGDVDLALRLQTYSYARRIDELDQYLQQAGGLARAS